MFSTRSTRGLAVLLLSATIVVTPGRTIAQTPEGSPLLPAITKRAVIAIPEEPQFLSSQLELNPTSSGLATIEELLHMGLTTLDDQGIRVSRLASRVPSLENGSWRFFPDGGMETTFELRPDARWHDGTPVTANDLAFTVDLVQAADLYFRAFLQRTLIESVDAPNSQTLVVRWRRPHISANALFSRTGGLPLPRHLLESSREADYDAIRALPYWREGFVGTGPYRLQTFVPASHMDLVANDRYVLGRPKIDEIRVRFIADGNTAIASILAGVVDLTVGRIPALDTRAIAMVRARPDIGLKTPLSVTGVFSLYPQFIDPNPSAIGDVRFRRALLHAIDRQAVVDDITYGVSSVADAYLGPSEPEFRHVQTSVIHYAHDPARSMQLLEELGYRWGDDGFYRDGEGRSLTVELRTSFSGGEMAAFQVEQYWRQVGIDSETLIIPPRLLADPEYRATHPGFDLRIGPVEADAITRLHSDQVPRAENRFLGGNRSRYASAVLDRLIEDYRFSIPVDFRMQRLAEAINHVTDQLPWMDLFYDQEPILAGRTLQHITPRVSGSTYGWNAHLWDLIQVR